MNEEEWDIIRHMHHRQSVFALGCLVAHKVTTSYTIEVDQTKNGHCIARGHLQARSGKRAACRGSAKRARERPSRASGLPAASGGWGKHFRS